jgi:RNA polymerase sigma factor for flagellar operon FliA
VTAGQVSRDAGDTGDTGAIDEAWRKYKQHGDIEARNQLVLHYAPIVKFAVGRLRSTVPLHVEEADLLGYGIFGLMDAIERFDQSLGVKFETYASSRIRGAVLDELRAIDWVPRSVRSKASAIEQTQARLRGELRRNPEDAEIAAALGTSKRALDRAREQTIHSNVIALEQLNAGDAADLPASADTVGDPAYDPIAQCERRETTRILIRALDRLSERERLVMTRYYFDGLTLAQIGADLHVTESRVCQIHTKALRRLRERAAAWGLTGDESRFELCAIA